MHLELNVPCVITKFSSAESTKLPGGKKEEFCAIVRLPGRAASAASSGRAPEPDAVLLMRGNTIAGIGDMLEVEGVELKVIDVVPVRDSVGKLDHFELTAMEWN
jgi:hypothetical protein